jgi:hypothetical protein
MKTFKQFTEDMGAGAAGGVSVPGPTNVTGPQSGTDPISATAVDMRKKRKHNPILMGMGKRK